VRLKVTSAVLNLHINWKAHAACDLNIIVKNEGLDKDVVTTGSDNHMRPI